MVFSRISVCSWDTPLILWHLLQCRFHNTRSTHTDVDDGICLSHTMECSRHKWIIIRCITEYYQLGTAEGILLLGLLCRCLDNFAHQAHRIHVKADAGRAHVDRRADIICLGQRLRNRADEILFRGSHSLGDNRGIPADEVDAELMSRATPSSRFRARPAI